MVQDNFLSAAILPNFFIVGAAKAGTTSMYYWLKDHPDVYVPILKEPSYFVHGYGFSNWDEYLKLFEPGKGKKAIGDTSATYLAAPESPEWLHKVFGPIKIIIILRNPVERAHSLYSWMVMEGYEWLETFEKALAEEENRFPNKEFYWKNPEYFWDYIYFRSGLYYEQVKRYLDTFGPELVRIYLFDELVQTPAKIYADICSYLGLVTEFQPSFGRRNPSRIPRFIGFQHFLRTKLFLKTNHLPYSWGVRSRQVVESAINLNKKIGFRPKINSGTAARLQQMYSSDVMRLADLINMDLSAWVKSPIIGSNAKLYRSC
jgi:Sulfotransferase domain